MAIDRVGLAALRQRRVVHLLTVAFLSRVAFAAMPLALLVALADVYAFGIAGLIDGTYTLLLAGLGPLRARLLDRFHPRVALMVMGAVSVSCMTLVVVAIARRWPWPVTLAFIVAAGLSSPPLNAALRVSWRRVVTGPEPLKVVHLADSIVEELGFVAGPALAGLGFFLFGPQVTYRLAVLSIAVSVVLYLAAALRYGLGQRPAADEDDAEASAADGVEPVGSAGWRTKARRWIGPLSEPPMVPIVAPLLVMGFMFGGLGVFIPAYTKHLGMLGWSGPLIALISVGGVIGGLVYGSVQWNASLWTRHRALATAFVIPCCALAFALSPWLLGALLLLAGLSVTPLFGTAFLLVDSAISPGTRHEASAWVGASTDLANGVAAIVVGSLVANALWRPALVTLSATALVCLVLVRLWRVPAEVTTPAADRAGVG